MDVYGVREKGDSLCIGGKAAARQVSTEEGRQASFVDGESENVVLKCLKYHSGSFKYNSPSSMIYLLKSVGVYIS